MELSEMSESPPLGGLGSRLPARLISSQVGAKWQVEPAHGSLPGARLESVSAVRKADLAGSLESSRLEEDGNANAEQLHATEDGRRPSAGHGAGGPIAIKLGFGGAISRCLPCSWVSPQRAAGCAATASDPGVTAGQGQPTA